MADPTQEYNSQFVQDQTATAEQAARDAYQQGMLENQRQDLAFRRAQQAWKEVMDRAGLTGQYEGQYTMPVQQWQSETFGTWGAPSAGQQTQAAQQQQWQQAFNTAAQYGQYYGPGQAPTAGAQTQAAQEQAYTQWLRAQQEARANQALQQQTAQSYLQLLSQMRGPQNWAQYQNVLGSTPQGMRDLVGAAMGQYIPGGGATTGVSPEAQSLQGMQREISGNGTNTMGAQQPNQMNLPAPNQIAPQAWSNLAPSQKEMLMSSYEAQGWHRPDAEALLSQSLPKYATNTPTAGTFRLR